MNFGGHHSHLPTRTVVGGPSQDYQAFFGTNGGAAAPLTSSGIGAASYGTIGGASVHHAVAAGAAGGISQGAK